ncbi:MAG: hypothetical protein K8F57_00205, partial [Alphaproteobacteria bacterium]|nr:hypothetical protein [Alphaproteobacteria bacterium]
MASALRCGRAVALAVPAPTVVGTAAVEILILNRRARASARLASSLRCGRAVALAAPDPIVVGTAAVEILILNRRARA